MELRSRSGRDATDTYPEITRTLRHLPVSDFILDGEVVALDERGRSSFERIQRRFGRDTRSARDEIETPTHFRPFDLLSVCGRDLRELPLRRRKELLAMFVPALGRVAYSDHVEVEGRALFDAASANELEGVIAKNAESRYVDRQALRPLDQVQSRSDCRPGDRRLPARQGIAGSTGIAAARLVSRSRTGVRGTRRLGLERGRDRRTPRATDAARVGSSLLRGRPGGLNGRGLDTP